MYTSDAVCGVCSARDAFRTGTVGLQEMYILRDDAMTVEGRRSRTKSQRVLRGVEPSEGEAGAPNVIGNLGRQASATFGGEKAALIDLIKSVSDALLAALFDLIQHGEFCAMRKVSMCTQNLFQASYA